jgi:hypothetical protein
MGIEEEYFDESSGDPWTGPLFCGAQWGWAERPGGKYWSALPKSAHTCECDEELYQAYYEAHETWLAAKGEAKERITLLAEMLLQEREYRRLVLHRLEERPLLTTEQQAQIEKMITNSKHRQRELLDRIRGIGSPKPLLSRLRAVWFRVAKL